MPESTGGDDIADVIGGCTVGCWVLTGMASAIGCGGIGRGGGALVSSVAGGEATGSGAEDGCPISPPINTGDGGMAGAALPAAFAALISGGGLGVVIAFISPGMAGGGGTGADGAADICDAELGMPKSLAGGKGCIDGCEAGGILPGIPFAGAGGDVGAPSITIGEIISGPLPLVGAGASIGAGIAPGAAGAGETTGAVASCGATH